MKKCINCKYSALSVGQYPCNKCGFFSKYEVSVLSPEGMKVLNEVEKVIIKFLM
jgi:hypothetical protein